MTLPAATPQPCNECPWRRDAVPGWLGPFSPEEWIACAHSDEPIACHLTIFVSGSWSEDTRQCRGAATFRENVLKLPRDHEVVTGPADRVKVFASNAEFMEHHS